MRQRLQKIFPRRRFIQKSAEELLSSGRVTVNGMIAITGDGADPETDEILLDGRPLNEEPRGSI